MVLITSRKTNPKIHKIQKAKKYKVNINYKEIQKQEKGGGGDRLLNGIKITEGQREEKTKQMLRWDLPMRCEVNFVK